MRGALVITFLAGLLPGVGYLYNRRKVLGVVVLATSLATAGVIAVLAPRDLESAIAVSVDPEQARLLAALLTVLVVLWVIVVVTTFLLVRPRGATPLRLGAGVVGVCTLCLVVMVPSAVAVRMATTQADLVDTVFAPQRSTTTPTDVSAVDPWGGRKRVNILLLGGDGGEGRDGVRTDSMILMSVKTRTGKATTFSLPRNMINAQFPSRHPLADLYPTGFNGAGEPGSWMLNAVYRQIPALHPDLLRGSDNPGADALKLAIQGSTGLRVDYYFLVNLRGFERLIDAMGGVQVNINTPVAIGGNTDLGIPPDDYLDPGPNQRLNGFRALWFARGRWGADDYQRMERQRCLVEAIVSQASPTRMLRRYQEIAEVGREVAFTDLPKELLPAFVDLALEAKQRPIKSVVFRSSASFNPGDPDFDWLRERVDNALHKPPTKPSASTPNSTSTPDPDITTETDAEPEKSAAVCSYDPVG